MLVVQGYYDGVSIKTLEKLIAKPNQRLIITVMDDFVEPEKNNNKKDLCGILAEYANPELVKKEKLAWQQEMVKKYGDI